MLFSISREVRLGRCCVEVPSQYVLRDKFPAGPCFPNSPMVNARGAVPQHQPSLTREPQNV